MTISRTRRFVSERGQALVETAIVLPIVVLLLLSMIDGGRIFYAWIVTTNGAREGARVAATGSSEADVIAHVELVMGNVTVTDLLTTNTAGPSGEAVTVEVRHAVTVITPLISAIVGNPFNVSSIAVMRLE
jgi:Flp pilus assembly protein TadG